MLIDCFLFCDELDLLEIRLNSLLPYVDWFVLCESQETFSGKPKSCYFRDNRERFATFPIISLVCPPLLEAKDAWEREHHQREFIWKGLVNSNPEDMILLSDVDEIPDLEAWNGQEGAFKQRMYYYYCNVYAGQNWKGTVAAKLKHIPTMKDIRDKRNKIPTVCKGGWHFSTLGDSTQIINKIESFSHQELNTPEIKQGIEEHRNTLTDPYNRRYKLSVEEPSGPKWLLANRDRYPHLFYASALNFNS